MSAVNPPGTRTVSSHVDRRERERGGDSRAVSRRGQAHGGERQGDRHSPRDEMQALTGCFHQGNAGEGVFGMRSIGSRSARTWTRFAAAMGVSGGGENQNGRGFSQPLPWEKPLAVVTGLPPDSTATGRRQPGQQQLRAATLQFFAEVRINVCIRIRTRVHARDQSSGCNAGPFQPSLTLI